jgi:hypothetical protein
MKRYVVALSLLLSGCHWSYGTRPVSIGGKRYDVTCPDPPPVKPDVLVGSTACVRNERK